MLSYSVDFLSRSYLQWPGRVMPVIADSEHYRAVREFVHYLQQTTYQSVLDLGTGSGILGLSLYRPGVQVLLTDQSRDACALARINMGSLPVQITVSDWFDRVQGQWDLIIANPPHGLDSDWAEFPQAQHIVPRSAVCAGHGGMDHIREIITHALPYMLGRLVLIHTVSQATLVRDLAVTQAMCLTQVMIRDSVQMTVLERVK